MQISCEEVQNNLWKCRYPTHCSLLVLGFEVCPAL